MDIMSSITTVIIQNIDNKQLNILLKQYIATIKWGTRLIFNKILFVLKICYIILLTIYIVYVIY